MLTPSQLAQLRAHLRPLMYTLSFASTVTGIILLLFLRLNRSRFLLLGMFSCLGMLYAAAFFYLLWRDLRLRLLSTDRERVRPRRPRPLGPDMLLDDIGKLCVYEIFGIELMRCRVWPCSSSSRSSPGRWPRVSRAAASRLSRDGFIVPHGVSGSAVPMQALALAPTPLNLRLPLGWTGLKLTPELSAIRSRLSQAMP